MYYNYYNILRRNSTMYGYIYETTDLMNGKTYIGLHRKPKFDKNYHGSGTRLLERIKKYGVKDLVTIMIDSAETEEELNSLEVYYIAERRKNGKCEYNIAPGGAFEPKNLNYIRIVKNEKEKAVPKEEIQTWINKGWKPGRAITVHNTGKIGIHKISSNKAVVNKYIYEKELDSYLNEGWELGFDINYKETSTAGLVWIHNDKGEKHMVTPEEKETIYKNWKDGIGNNSNNGVATKYLKNSLWIHKGKERKRIPVSDREKYPDWEDGIGSVKPRQKQVWINNGEIQKYVYESNLSNFPNFKLGKLKDSSK